MKLEPGHRPPRGGILLAGVLAAVATAYSSVPGAPFVWDDHVLISKRPSLKAAGAMDALKMPFITNGAGVMAAPYYRPVVTASYVLDWRLWRGRPGGFHVTNLAIHLAAVSLLFSLCLRAGASAWGAGFLAALFGLAPRLTESVAWVSGRTDLLAGVFVLLALRLQPEGPGRWARRIGAALALFAGLLSKEVAIAGLLAVAVLEASRWRRREQSGRWTAVHLLPVALAGATYAVLRHLALKAFALAPAPTLTPPSRPVLVLEALGRYVGMVLDPLRPNLQIGWVTERSYGFVVLGVAALVLSAWGAWQAARHPPRPWLAAGLGLAAGGIAPVLQIVPVTIVAAADRFLYVPLAGLALAAAAALPREVSPRLRRMAAWAGLLALLAEGARTFVRAQEWSDEIRLWTHTLEVASPRNPVPANELANALRKAWRTEESLAWYQRALETAGTSNFVIITNVAYNLAELGRFDEAARAVRAALARRPDVLVHYQTLATIEVQQLHFGEARRILAEGSKVAPNDPSLPLLAASLDGIEEAFRQIPPEVVDEPTPLVGRRAGLWTTIGNRPEAVRQWMRFLERDDCPAGMAGDAAVYVVLNGTREESDRAIERARRAGVDPDRLQEIENGSQWRHPARR